MDKPVTWLTSHLGATPRPATHVPRGEPRWRQITCCIALAQALPRHLKNFVAFQAPDMPAQI